MLHRRERPIELHLQDGTWTDDVKRIVRPGGKSFDAAEFCHARFHAWRDERQFPVGRKPSDLQPARNHALVVADIIEIAIAVDDERRTTIGYERQSRSGRIPVLKP